MSPFDLVALLLLMAAVFGLANERWIGLPEPISLLIGALGLSLLVLAVAPLFGSLDVTGAARAMVGEANLPHLLLDGVLAFLLFAASLHVDLNELRTNRLTILLLATAGVMISTVVFGGLIWLAFQATSSPVPIRWCLTLAAVLAPTDAVAVDALLRKIELPRSTKAAISGESLFNDGVGVVIFLIALASTQGERGLIGHGKIMAALLTQGLSAFVVGLVTGFVAARAMRLASNFNLELTISLALVLGTYRLASELGISGPIAVVAAGLVVGNQAGWHGPHAVELPGIIAFWSLIDQLLNALLFLLIGFEMLSLDARHIPVLPILASIPLAILARAISVAIPLRVLDPRGRGNGQARAIGVLTWAGLRGGVSVALALTLPDSPYHDELLSICYAVVVFTIIVQGLTMPAVLRFLSPPHQIIKVSSK
jgi:CPA1 family monovalent cation:H+ antiporter